jgi:hypothetical protein
VSRQAQPEATHRALYDGREKIGSIKQIDDEFVAYDQRGQVLGRFNTVVKAANAISKAAARAS